MTQHFFALTLGLSILSASYIQAAPITMPNTSRNALLTISHLRCENVANPLGVEELRPRLSWRLASPARGARQAAYQILVASTPQLLAQNRGDVWDSGRVASDDTTSIAYAGKPLASNTRYFWKVRAWNAGGQISASAPAFWHTGLLQKSDWRGQWIGYEAPRDASQENPAPTLEGASWVWFPEAVGDPISSAPVGTRWFRRAVTIPEGREMSSAMLRVAADNAAILYVNGQEVGRSQDSWKSRRSFDVKALLRPGANVIALAVTNASDTGDNVPNPAGLAAQLSVRFNKGEPLSVVTDATWKTTDQEVANFQAVAFDDAAWKPAQVLAAVGQGPWGAVANGSLITASPAPYLRRAFSLQGKVKRATAFICGLGYYEMSLNGRKVGDHMLDPGWTTYDKRSLYVAHDVTKYLQAGQNAIGVTLGTGHFDDHVLSVWDFDRASWRARPKMLLEMRVEFEDGRTQSIVSDGSWKAAASPIRFDSISGGEHYDARHEMPGWDTPAFNDSRWVKAQVVAPVQGVLAAQIAPPVKVTQVLAPVKVSQPKPGVWIFDMGQNFAGVPQLRINGRAGAQVSMRCAEKLYPDGTLDQSNIDQFVKRRDPEQRFQFDIYTLKGRGREIWNPRFTYHGYQYVEVTGFPGRPTLDNLRGLVMHSAFDRAGEFACSDPLQNATQRNALWSYRSNWHGIPTDCPQREKNGWTGDAHLAAEMGLYNFDATANYEKWLDDIADVQRPNGELPGIVPTSGWGYGIGPSWDAAYPHIVWYLYQYRDDTRVIERHYDRLAQYLNYLSTRAENGIVSYGLGDWLPAKTQTPNDVTSTGYYFADARLMAQMARLLGKTEDEKKYLELAASIKAAFNAKFVDAKTGRVANGSITAQSTALFQGLAEEKDRAAILAALLAEVEKQNHHMDVGILGAKYVLNVLADNGRVDVAWRILQTRSMPSYGYWIERGATTMWERWTDVGNKDDSRNHVMFGDVSAWYYKYLAGIQMAAPGFKSIILKPHLVAGLTSARATHDSTRGRIASSWAIRSGVLNWSVTVPANTRATVFVPVSSQDAAAITEGGQPIARARGVKPLRQEDGAQVFEVEPGSYNFACPRRS